jgi:hypothetical protein
VTGVVKQPEKEEHEEDEGHEEQQIVEGSTSAIHRSMGLKWDTATTSRITDSTRRSASRFGNFALEVKSVMFNCDERDVFG